MIRAALLCMALAAATPATAQDLGRDADLALRLIFDDCLAFARDGATPFKGISHPAPQDAALAALAPWFPASSTVLRLDDWNYLAFWGAEDGKRFCTLIEATQDATDGIRIGPDFFAAVTARAAAEGLVADYDHSAYARRDGRWRLPENAEDPFKGLVLSLSIGPTGSATEHLQALGASAPQLLAN